MNDQDLSVLKQQDHTTLARWHCELNCHVWPAQIPNPEPSMQKWDPACRQWQIMQWIEATVGKRLVMRAWNRQMTDQEFDDFFRGNYEGDRAAWMRYAKRTGFQRQEAFERSPRWIDRCLATVASALSLRLPKWDIPERRPIPAPASQPEPE